LPCSLAAFDANSARFTGGTAAIDVPASETKSATSEMTSAGLGVRNFRINAADFPVGGASPARG
jgi:hypothetical protein